MVLHNMLQLMKQQNKKLSDKAKMLNLGLSVYCVTECPYLCRECVKIACNAPLDEEYNSPRKTEGSSLCWCCKHAGTCEKPVEGSTFVEHDSPLGIGYNIVTCPKFKRG